MSSSEGAWLPRGSLFLEKSSTPPVRPHRPWNQGDIFADVPLALTQRTNAGEPKCKTKQTHAALLGHTCSLRGGGSVSILQNLAEVRPAKEAEIARFDAAQVPWDADFKVFPLVDLFEDALWVVDFNIIGTTHFKHLSDKRVACLSLEGWAAFQRRYANHSLRIDQSIEDRAADLRRLWGELTLWEEWCSRGYEEADFGAWLNQPIETQGQFHGTIRRAAVELASEVIREELPESQAQ